MAFGRGTKTGTEGVESTAPRFFETASIPLSVDAPRVFRLLEDPADPQFPEEGVQAYSFWLPVTINGSRRKENGKENKRRVFFRKDAKELFAESDRMKILFRTFMNVYDVTPVVIAAEEDGKVQLAYRENPTDQKFYIGSGDYRKVVEGKGKPNNRVMILEAPFALVSAMEGLPALNADDSGVDLPLLNMTIKAVMRRDASGKSKGLLAAVTAEQYHGDTSYYQLPRWDLRYFDPYPTEAIEELMSGVEYSDVLKKYKIHNKWGKVDPYNLTVDLDDDDGVEEEMPF